MVESSVRIDGVNTDDTSARLKVKQVLSVAADGHVEVVRSIRQRAENRVGNGRQRAARSNRESRHGERAGVIYGYPFAIGSDGVAAVAIAKCGL